MIAQLQQLLLTPQASLRIHLIGVAGSGMSGLAQLLLEMGHRVSGCDRSTTVETERLQQEGMAFFSPHTAVAVEDAEVVVYSSAIPPSNPALARARELGLSCLRRADCLAAILHTKKGILVSGTHGKTTTSSLSAHLLREGGKRPSHYVGAEIPVLGRNAFWDPASEFLVAEGDESDGTLVNYHPEHSIVLNIEAEHLDHYRNLDEIKQVFQRLIDQSAGYIFYCKECPNATELLQHHPRALSYGWENADYTASDLVEQQGRTVFTLHFQQEAIGRFELGIPGRHNVLNAMAAIALALQCSVSLDAIARGLASFAGAKRRFETKYLDEELRVVDDYGHHPTELAATLQTARSLQPKRLVVLFQPHRYTRTQRLADDFGQALQAADLVYVCDVYPASEVPIPGITGLTIVEATERHGDTKVVYLPDLATAHLTIGNALKSGDLFLTLGAGNVHEAGTRIIRDWQVLADLKERGGDALKAHLYEPMRRHTTMLVGGPAQFWLEPSSFQAFKAIVQYCRKRGIPIRVIGRGSNLLVQDGGIRGAVIHPSGGEFSEVQVDGDCLTAGAGARFKKVASVAQQHGLSDFEWMEGIPGNVGGGLRMNAGAMGTETFDQVIEVTFLDEDGEIRTRSREDIVAHYRQVPELQYHYALKAKFKGTPAPAAEIAAKMEASKQKRRQSQPVAASAGCIFKNPTTLPAGKLVDELGLKDAHHGGARVSTIHGNFIVNEHNAQAADILALIEKIRHEAREQRQINLEPEVQITGDPTPQF